jgi:outer membrane lipoprotein-sorting protein
MKTVLVLAAALLLPQEKNEAEELFKKMEAKFVQAASVSSKSKGAMEQGDLTLDLEMEICRADANRGRASFTMKQGEKTVSSQAVSDGKTTRVAPTDKGPAQTFATHEKLGDVLSKALARGGVMMAVGSLSNTRDPKADPETLFQAKEFNLGAKEKVQDRETQAVEYKLAAMSETDISVTVWIDLKTHLPVKRTIKSKRGSVQETYSDIRLDEKFDASKFELPKDAK